jgi:hypothetical protein
MIAHRRCLAQTAAGVLEISVVSSVTGSVRKPDKALA